MLRTPIRINICSGPGRPGAARSALLWAERIRTSGLGQNRIDRSSPKTTDNHRPQPGWATNERFGPSGECARRGISFRGARFTDMTAETDTSLKLRVQRLWSHSHGCTPPEPAALARCVPASGATCVVPPAPDEAPLLVPPPAPVDPPLPASIFDTTHEPATHASPIEQALPQLAQFLASVWRSAHPVAHIVPSDML